MHNFLPRLACIAAACIIACEVSAQAVDTFIYADNHEKTYQDCVAASQVDAEAALEMSIRWQRLNGGNPARHCQAMSLANLGDFEEAARLLEALAAADTANAQVKAGLWHQAGQMHSDAGNHQVAIEAFGRALDYAPGRVEILIDRAIAYAGHKEYWAAIDDLNTYIDIHPRDALAYSLRASAYRYLEMEGLARDDIERSLDIASDNPDAWLERGLLATLSGNGQEASAAWLRVLEIAPDSVAADIARAHIEAAALKHTDAASPQKSKSE